MNIKMLKSKMALEGMTQEDIAKILKLSKTATSNKFNNKLKFSLDQAETIVKTLELTPKEAYDIFFN